MLFNFKLKDIFTTVKEPVDRNMTQAQTEEFLLGKIRQEFGPLFDTLSHLPEKDGKKFSVTFGKTQQRDRLDIGPSFSALISYKPVKSAFDGEYGFFLDPVHGEPQPEIKIALSLGNDVFGADVTEKYSPFHPTVTHFSHPFQKSTPFQKALKDVYKGLQAIAPDRMAEINALTAPKPKAQALTA